MSGNSAEPGRTTTSRVLAILGAFSPAARSLSLSELSQNSGLPIPTAHRLTTELVTWGALEKTETGRYRIGMRIWEIGSLAPTQQGLRTVALPYMQDLYEATHENVQLAVREGNRVVYVDAISGHRSVGTETRVGGNLPLHVTAVGKIVLAYSEPQLLSSTLAAGLTSYTRFTITESHLLAEAIQQIRAEQLAYSREELTFGVCAVAAPVLANDGSLIAALAIVGRSSMNITALAPALRTAALGIGRRMTALPAAWRRSPTTQLAAQFD
ncbi:IclR family transcriptional regulator [Lacisediminihabitans profunda]|uniref:IclR family transcriptional regulator n=1 Tax=Lacisediminihabitans profunda TaxID=2594790 RepID=A0A5C8ULM2_9MICO|nr:IclR family transcriptional regulator [Lacisediminihabitans profunda]TXN28353.1 IclR family transcriptional regulator [Lacisediminihabitans profunda]